MDTHARTKLSRIRAKCEILDKKTEKALFMIFFTIRIFFYSLYGILRPFFSTEFSARKFCLCKFCLLTPKLSCLPRQNILSKRTRLFTRNPKQSLCPKFFNPCSSGSPPTGHQTQRHLDSKTESA